MLAILLDSWFDHSTASTTVTMKKSNIPCCYPQSMILHGFQISFVFVLTNHNRLQRLSWLFEQEANFNGARKHHISILVLDRQMYGMNYIIIVCKTESGRFQCSLPHKH